MGFQAGLALAILKDPEIEFHPIDSSKISKITNHQSEKYDVFAYPSRSCYFIQNYIVWTHHTPTPPHPKQNCFLARNESSNNFEGLIDIIICNFQNTHRTARPDFSPGHDVSGLATCDKSPKAAAPPAAAPKRCCSVSASATTWSCQPQGISINIGLVVGLGCCWSISFESILDKRMTWAVYNWYGV